MTITAEAAAEKDRGAGRKHPAPALGNPRSAFLFRRLARWHERCSDGGYSAYHIDYRDDCASYVDAFWHIVDWDAVKRNLAAAELRSLLKHRACQGRRTAGTVLETKGV